jgi:hypothetical protein
VVCHFTMVVGGGMQQRGGGLRLILEEGWSVAGRSSVLAGCGRSKP